MVKMTALEKHLKDRYIPIFQDLMGMNASQAKKTFADLLGKIKQEAKAEDSENLPPNLGDLLLERETSEEKVKRVLSRKRSQGVRDQDIRWWWNMHDLERRMMAKVDEVFVYTLFLKLTKEDGLSKEQATRKIRSIRPIFGDPDAPNQPRGKDAPLPDELRDRVNQYITVQAQKDPEGFRDDAESFSSFNAYIRNRIKKGKL